MQSTCECLIESTKTLHFIWRSAMLLLHDFNEEVTFIDLCLLCSKIYMQIELFQKQSNH